MHIRPFKRFTICLFLITASLISIPSHASTVVDVGLKVSNHHHALTQSKCALRVPQGSDGIHLLNAAVASGCISSYNLQSFAFGTFVRCINGVCASDVRYWAMRENCVYTDYGVDGFRADQGDELAFTFESWITYIAPVVC